MKRLYAVVTLSVLAAVLLAGCNLFSFTAPSDSVTDYKLDGEEALRNGDYQSAIDNFTKALDEDPDDAEAHWGIAKAYIRESGYTTLTIMGEMCSFQTNNAALPFMNAQIDSVNSLYRGSIFANEHLEKIYSGEATGGGLTPDGIALDYTGTLSLQAILSFRDTNQDSSIDMNDINLEAAFNTLGDFTLDNNAWNQLSPEEQDAMLNVVTNLLNQGDSTLANFITGMDTDSVTVGFDTENLDSVIVRIRDGFWHEYGPGGGVPDSYMGTDHLRALLQGGRR